MSITNSEEPDRAIDSKPSHQAVIPSNDSATQADISKAYEKDEDLKPIGRPEGVRFALLFSCLLLGNLSVGYVRLPNESSLYVGERT